jgi:hypothetical protein
MLVALMLAASCVSHGQKPRDGIDDIHVSPLSVVRAMYEGIRRGNADLMLKATAPKNRARLQTEIREFPEYRDGRTFWEEADDYIRKTWGIDRSDIKLDKIAIVVIKRWSDERLKVDIQHDGRSNEDAAIITEINGKWYVEWL